MRKMMAVTGAALLLALCPAGQAQSKVQSQLGEPVQFVEMTQEMQNFLNRYAKAATGKPCRNFSALASMGGVVLTDPEIGKLKVEDLFRALDQEVTSNHAEYGRGAKVFMDKPRNVIITVTNEPGQGPMMTLVQVRGQRMLLTLCSL